MPATDTPTVARLRRLLIRTRPALARDGYPPEVRGEVCRFARGERAKGTPWSTIARRLGISRLALCTWAADGVDVASVESTFVPVLVTDSAPASAESGPMAHPLSVVTPRGFRLEGLDLDSAVSALERLG